MTQLVRYISAATVWLLPEWSEGPQAAPRGDTWDVLAAAGYEGVQVFTPEHVAAARGAGLDVHSIGRADTVDDLRSFVDRWSAAGVSSATVHLGTGFETPADGDELVGVFTELATAAPIDLLLETHRATITQDPARLLGFVADHPDLRITADLAHWYLGVEMTYGGFDWKVDALAPVLERTRLIHGRIASTGCSQMPLDGSIDGDEPVHVQHFRSLWGALFRGVLASPDAPERLPFAPELLPPVANYARTVAGPDGAQREEADRWVQARRLCEFAESLFTEAAAAPAPTIPTGKTGQI